MPASSDPTSFSYGTPAGPDTEDLTGATSTNSLGGIFNSGSTSALQTLSIVITNILSDNKKIAFEPYGVQFTLSDGTTGYSALHYATTIELGGLNIFDDVVITGTPSDNQPLAYNTATSKWINQTLAFDGIDPAAIIIESEGISSNDNDITLPTSAAVKDYVDTHVTSQDLDFQGDTGGTLSIDLDSEVLDIAGGTGINTAGAVNTLTVNIDDTVVTKVGEQTLADKTLTTPIIASLKQSGSYTLTMPAATDTLVGKATTDTLTNKTLTSPVITTPQINDTSANHQYIVAVSELAADRTITLPLLAGNDEITFNAHTQTLTNKTLTTPVIASLQQASGSNTLTMPAATDTLVGKATTDTLTNKTFDVDGTGNSLSNIADSNIKASAAIADTKLATIATAGKVALTALEIDGGTDIGDDLVDADLIIIDDGAGGTNKKSTLTRAKKYIYSAISGEATVSDTGVLSVGTIDDPVFTGAISGAAFQDDNAFSSASASKVASSESIKAYVDSVASGLDVKDSVRVATTAAGTLASSFENSDIIDGITLATNDRILIKDQGTGSENGIYTVNSSGAPTRATDFDSDTEVTSGAFTFVEVGTTNADTGWVLTTDGTIVVGTTALVFSQFSGAGQITAGAGLTKSGDTINAIGTADKITVSADAITIASGYVGQNTITTLGTITTGTWNGIAIADGHISSASTWNSKQAGDAGLTSISGLTTAADKMIYTTGSDTYAVTSLTAAGRAILDDADAAAQRTTLGLAIGTNVQAYDAQLDTLAGLTANQVGGLVDLATLEAPASDGQFIVATGSGAFAYESGSTARTSLGLGTASILNSVDEDNMASNSATLLPTQQSVKAYVDANAGAAGAQTAITSILNTALVVGRDADNQIKFSTDDQIIFEVSGGDNVIFKASGEIEATSLDIGSGGADINGTLEADVITVAGVALSTVIADEATALAIALG